MRRFVVERHAVVEDYRQWIWRCWRLTVQAGLDGEFWGAVGILEAGGVVFPILLFLVPLVFHLVSNPKESREFVGVANIVLYWLRP